MAEQLEKFLSESPIAQRVKLASRVVLKRTSLSPRELIHIKETGKYGPLKASKMICELQIGAHVLTRGKIIKRRGEYYFKVLENPIIEQVQGQEEEL